MSDAQNVPESPTAPQAPRRARRWPYVLVLMGAAAVLAYNSKNVMSRRGESHPLVGEYAPVPQLAPCVFVDAPLGPDGARGKVLLINFWGTWCPPCREEFPHLLALRRRFESDRRFAFISVSCELSDEGEHFEALPIETRQYLSSEGEKFPVYCDPDARFRSALTKAMGDEGFFYPTTLIVDAEGRFRGIWQGYRSGDEIAMAKLVEKLLK